MNEHHAPDAPRAQEQETRIPAEDGGVCELDEAADQGWYDGGTGRVGEAEFVEVVDVCYAEV